MGNLTAFEAYTTFLSLQLHFKKDSYDYFKYHGKVGATQESFMVKKERFMFQSFAKKYSKDEFVDYCVANLVNDPSKWMGHLSDEESVTNYKDFLKSKMTGTQIFRNEMEESLSACSTPSDLFKDDGTGSPLLINLYNSGVISLNSIVILDGCLSCMEGMNKKYAGHFLWDRLWNKYVKYKPFVSYDVNKTRAILKELINDR